MLLPNIVIDCARIAEMFVVNSQFICNIEHSTESVSVFVSVRVCGSSFSLSSEFFHFPLFRIQCKIDMLFDLANLRLVFFSCIRPFIRLFILNLYQI